MAGDLITESFQYEFAGLLFGSSTDINVEGAEGLDDLPDIDSMDIPWDANHGSASGSDLARSRVVQFAGDIMAATDTALASALDSLRDTFTVGTVATLAWQHPGETKKMIWARCRRRSIPTTLRRSLGSPTWVVQLVAVDPLVYSAAESSDSTTRTTAGSGFTPPFTPAFTLGASTDGTLRATNVGSADASWTARLEGPLTNPVITNLATRERLAFSANGGLVLGAGEFVAIDAAARSVLLAGTASRRSQLSLDSRWWSLAPGDTDIELTADAGTGTLSVTWRSAWI